MSDFLPRTLAFDLFLRLHTAALAVILWGAAAPAAPPSVTALYPGGAERGASSEIAVRGKPGSAPVSVWCDRTGVEAVASEKGDRLTITVAETAEPGPCWLRLYNDEGASELLPLLIGVLPEWNEAEPNDSLDECTQLETLPAVVNGTLHESGEVDAYGLYLKAGDRLILSVQANGALGSPMDAVLQLVSPAGFVLAQNDDHHGFDPQIEFLAEQEGRYFARIFSFPAEPNSSIRFAGDADYVYRLTLTTGPFVDHLSPAGTDDGSPGLLPRGWNLPSQPVDPQAVPGLHHSRPLSEVAAFLSVDGQAASANEVQLPVRAAGHILTPGEVDVLQVRASQGESLRIRVRSRSFGAPLDPVLQISDANGKRLAQSDDESRTDLDVDMTWKPPESGTYRFAVSDRFGHGGLRYVYHLFIDREQPRCELSVNADSFVVGPDKPLEIPVTISREGGFDDELTVTVAGLPEGMTLTEAVSQGKGDSSKKVTLKIAAGSVKEFNGPVRILGRASGEHALEITATTQTRLPGHRSSSLWLTCKGGGNK